MCIRDSAKSEEDYENFKEKKGNQNTESWKEKQKYRIKNCRTLFCRYNIVENDKA